MEVPVANNRRSFPLTSENLKKFNKQRERSDSLYSRRRIPKRTAADGKSARNSPSSPHIDKSHKNKNNTENDPRTTETRVRKSLYRPHRADSYRRNPEGRSRNGSSLLPRFAAATKVYYDDTDDNHIPYEDPSYLSRQSRASSHGNNSIQGIAYEISSYTSSSATEVVQTTTKTARIGSAEEGSVPSSTSVSSGDDVFDDLYDDDDDDDTTEDETTTATKQTTPYSISTSSSSSSSSCTMSSIPTNAPSPTQESVTTNMSIEENKPLMHPLVELSPQKQQQVTPINSETSSVNLPNSLSTGNDKNHEHIKLREREQTPEEMQANTSQSSTPGSSIGLHFDSGLEVLENTTRKDSYSSGLLSRESYITIRNWTRWGRFSGGGYSITDKIMAPCRKETLWRNRSSIVSSKISSSSETSSTDQSQSGESNQSQSKKSAQSKRSIDVLEIRSVQSLRVPEKLQSPKPENMSSSEELYFSSRTSKMEAKKPRAKSLINLPHSSVCKQENRNTKGVKLKRKNRREAENDVEGVDFKNRTKQIPKLRDRPKRPKPGLTKAEYREKDRARRTTRRSRNIVNQEFILSNQEDANSTITTSSYTAPPHRKAKLSTLSQRPKSSVSKTTDSSLSRATSAMSINTFPGRRIKAMLKPLHLDDSGFATNRSPSSLGSLHPIDTPFSPVLRSTSALSLRSLDSEYSSYPSVCDESDSCFSRSASSVSIQSDGESAAIGPDSRPSTPTHHPSPQKVDNKEKVVEPNQNKKLKEIDKQVAELPNVRRTRPHVSRKSSPYYSSMVPAILERIKALRTAINKTQTQRKGHKKSKQKVS